MFHTHGKTNTGTTDELVNGSNCTTAGDEICDTPADPNLSGKVNGSCQYTGNLKDANGDFYNPSVPNIMSYAPGSCRNVFSQGQYDRIRRGFEQGRSYLNFTSSEFTAFFDSDAREICIGQEVS
ncbi:M43 family zinc metalloprotease, partial [Fulvivirga aurantia]|uniref:M43 family zinc metalloprotease n=1 Tax=Fulvivirga aurantia TaxID=2529383 RepID=UPI001FEAEB75